MRDLAEKGAAVLANQPFSLMVGTILEHLQPGSASLSVCVTEKLKQQHGFVHGGIVSYLADNTLTFAGGSILGDSVTAEYKINYIAPALGQKLLAKADVINAGKRQALCKCEVFSINDGKISLVAFASGSVRKVERA